MKISDLQPNLNQIGKSAGAANQANGLDFARILAQELRGLEQSGPAGATAPAAPATTVAPQLRIEGLSLSETAISTLDAFGQALGNPALKSGDLEPYVAALEEETAGLLAMRNDLPADDPLAKLLDRVATVSYLESAKYRRGDYQ